MCELPRLIWMILDKHRPKCNITLNLSNTVDLNMYQEGCQIMLVDWLCHCTTRTHVKLVFKDFMDPSTLLKSLLIYNYQTVTFDCIKPIRKYNPIDFFFFIEWYLPIGFISRVKQSKFYHPNLVKVINSMTISTTMSFYNDQLVNFYIKHPGSHTVLISP